MNNKLYKKVKRVVSIVVAVSIVTVCGISLSTKAEASGITETTDAEGGIKYVQYSNDFNYQYYLDSDTAPTYTAVDTNGVGYLFGGWYDKVDNSYSPIADTNALNNKKGVVVAKFVPAQTMSVKCQNWAGTNSSSDGVLVRVISGTDSKNYSNYGFIISRIDENGNETVLTQEPFVSKEVYSKFDYYDSLEDDEPDTYLPSQLFGNAAKHFVSCTVGRIPQSAHGTIICIKPFWDTLDGTRVYGLNKFAHVEDGYLGYVNVPVNLNILSTDNDAAAGFLSVECKSEGLTFLGLEDGVENGKVFDEMEVYVTSDGLIKCVGNTSDVSDKDTNDIYINLRFERNNFNESNQKPDTTFLKFAVENEDFCDSFENDTTADVWNIIY